MRVAAGSLGGVAIAAATAHAHGGPPAALGVVAADEDGRPSVVLLDEGIAAQDGDVWRFVCPAVWGNPNTDSDKAPLARSIDGHESWLIGDDDLYLGRDGAWQAQGQPELSSAAVIAIAGAEGALYALRVDARGSYVLRLDDAAKTVLYESETIWNALAVDSDAGRIYLARATDVPTLLVRILDIQGRMLEERELPVQTAPQSLRLRAVAGRLFALLYSDARYELAAIDAGFDVLAQALSPIRGPVATADGTLWTAVDGELRRRDGASEGDFVLAGELREVTCLERWGSTAYACAGPELYRLESDGTGELLFTIDGIGPPLPAWVPDHAERDCRLQWLLYRSDIERIGLTPGSDGEGGTGSSAGAAVGAGGGSGSDAAGSEESTPVSGSDSGSSAGCTVGIGAPAGEGALGTLGWACIALALVLRPRAARRRTVHGDGRARPRAREATSRSS